MEPIKIAFAGAGGYADYCLGLLLDYIPESEYKLVGIVDPYAANSPRYQFFLKNDIPLYDSVEELFDKQQVDAIYISSPISFHKQQSEIAIRNGCAVMCEKPLTAQYKDTISLRNLSKQYAVPFGVGFQWSFAPAILQAKREILNDEYGKPISLKVFVSWQRFDEYYSGSGWKGHITDSKGTPVYDSVVTNATAHYLHNIFFMLGTEMDRSVFPKKVWGSVHRAKPIESFDSCFLKGEFANGAQFLFLSTHSGDTEISPIIEYQFEKGVLRIDANEDIPIVRGFVNGEERVYGEVSTPQSDKYKISAFFEAIRGGAKLTCPIDAVLPHQAVCDAIFKQCTIQEFPKEICYHTSNPDGRFVTDLCRDLKTCFDQMQTPAEAGFAWAGNDTILY